MKLGTIYTGQENKLSAQAKSLELTMKPALSIPRFAFNKFFKSSGTQGILHLLVSLCLKNFAVKYHKMAASVIPIQWTQSDSYHLHRKHQDMVTVVTTLPHCHEVIIIVF